MFLFWVPFPVLLLCCTLGCNIVVPMELSMTSIAVGAPDHIAFLESRGQKRCRRGIKTKGRPPELGWRGGRAHRRSLERPYCDEWTGIFPSSLSERSEQNAESLFRWSSTIFTQFLTPLVHPFLRLLCLPSPTRTLARSACGVCVGFHIRRNRRAEPSMRAPSVWVASP